LVHLRKIIVYIAASGEALLAGSMAPLETRGGSSVTWEILASGRILGAYGASAGSAIPLDVR
jgi:hypothetical protein